ncbi:hypothetical protein PTE_04361 [Photorhabdus khanii NC19]|uniref:Uncharacterized protein n=1 Tax=Photorhabdus khanii NC19 TaxID=1004151 RepID=W3V105_9GAMM|nr:hypothetical protein PTE_04361 [Photorhabdus khanii NC19]
MAEKQNTAHLLTKKSDLLKVSPRIIRKSISKARYR